ncbi:MAG TPA: hypothetical protein VMI09_01805 [Candidatus Binataceae bacterium]|nr:hypothetical protein [Candidatus Binataceae bacterium]
MRRLAHGYWLIAMSVELMVAGKLITDGTAIVGPVKLTDTDTGLP